MRKYLLAISLFGLTALDTHAWDLVRLDPLPLSGVYGDYKNNTSRSITMMGRFVDGNVVFFAIAQPDANKHFRIVFRNPSSPKSAQYIADFKDAYRSGKKLKLCVNTPAAEGPGPWNGYQSTYNFSVLETDNNFQYVFE